MLSKLNTAPMFSGLKKLFGRSGEAAGGHPRQSAPTEPLRPQAAATAELPPGPRPGNAASQAGGASLPVPLRSIISRLSPELLARVRWNDVGQTEIQVSMPKVLSQLPQGMVRISFGELRQASPDGVFSVETDRDQALVEIPLQEVLSRINPVLLARRPAQKPVAVPADVKGPFGGDTEVGIVKAPLTSPPRPRPPAPAEDTSLLRRAEDEDMPLASNPEPPRAPSTGVIAAGPSQTAFFRRTPPPAAAPPMTSVTVAMPAPISMRAATTQAAPAPIAVPAAVEKPAVKTSLPGESSAMPVLAATPGLAALKSTMTVATPSRAAVPVAAPPSVRTVLPPAVPIAAAPARLEAPAAAQVPLNPPAALPPEPVSSGETRFLTASLADLSAAWPPAVRAEIVKLNVGNSFVALPFGAIETSMKQGKVFYSWKSIRSWIKPPLPWGHTSPLDATALELPMPVVTPLFMSELRAARPQKQVLVDDKIPNLFGASGLIEAAPAPEPAAPAPKPLPAAPGVTTLPAKNGHTSHFVRPQNGNHSVGDTALRDRAAQQTSFFKRVAAPGTAPAPAPAAAAPQAVAAIPASRADTNYFAKGDLQEQAEEKVPFKTPAAPGTSFLKRYASPNDIVQKAGELPGVAGAIVALPDGLLVASKVSADMNADTLGAFLPQIFNRVSQSTRELRMGELNNLSFTVGNVPWKIFRVGSIFFAAFGAAGQSLPTAQLAQIAAELDRKEK